MFALQRAVLFCLTRIDCAEIVVVTGTCQAMLTTRQRITAIIRAGVVVIAVE